jgi:hypothetical protein
MSLPGQTRRFDGAPLTSGLASTPDILSAYRHVSKVPIGDMVRLLENEREAANRGGLSCFYGRAVSLTLRSASWNRVSFSPRAPVITDAESTG